MSFKRYLILAGIVLAIELTAFVTLAVVIDK
jgi:hypothetical protein